MQVVHKVPRCINFSSNFWYKLEEQFHATNAPTAFSLPGSSTVGANPKVKPAHKLVVEGVLQAEGSHGRVYPDACAIAIAAAGLPPRARRVPQHALPAVQVCSVVKEQRALQGMTLTVSAAFSQ